MRGIEEAGRELTKTMRVDRARTLTTVVMERGGLEIRFGDRINTTSCWMGMGQRWERYLTSGHHDDGQCPSIGNLLGTRLSTSHALSYGLLE